MMTVFKRSMWIWKRQRRLFPTFLRHPTRRRFTNVQTKHTFGSRGDGLLVAPTAAVAQYGYDYDYDSYGYYDDYGYDYDGDDYEYEAGEGYHEEEWYDPGDWFNDDGRVSYETDRDYDYDYGYDNNYYTSDLYDTEPDYDNYSYTTSELYDTEPDYDDYTYTLDRRDGSDRDYSNTIGGREYDRDRQNRMTRQDNQRDQRMQRDRRMQQDRYANQSRDNRNARMDRRDRDQVYATNRDGRRQMDDRQRQQDQRRQQMSRQGTQQFQGEVQNTQTFQHQGHQHRMVTLRNDQGQRMQVDLGPTQETSDLTLRQGTQVTVQGKRGTVAGRQLIKAMRISTGDDTRIRDRPEARAAEPPGHHRHDPARRRAS